MGFLDNLFYALPNGSPTNVGTSDAQSAAAYGSMGMSPYDVWPPPSQPPSQPRWPDPPAQIPPMQPGQPIAYDPFNARLSTLASTPSASPAPTQRSPGPPLSLAPPYPGSEQAPQPGFLDRLGTGLGGLYNAAPMLMAMGGATMRNGLGAGLQAGADQMAHMQQNNTQQAQRAATVQALMKAGMPPAQAQAAALNPQLLRIIAPRFFNGAGVAQPGGGSAPPGNPPAGRYQWHPQNGMEPIR